MLTDHDIDPGQAALAAGLIDARQLAQAYHAAGQSGIDLPFSAVLIRAGLAPDAVRNLEAERLGVPLSHRDTLALYSDVSAPPRIVPPPERLPLPPTPAEPAGTASDRLGLPAERFAARFVPTDELGRGGARHGAPSHRVDRDDERSRAERMARNAGRSAARPGDRRPVLQQRLRPGDRRRVVPQTAEATAVDQGARRAGR